MKGKYNYTGMICILFLMPFLSASQTTTNANTTQQHIVAKGETLSSIARQNHCTVAQIIKLNPALANNTLKYDLKINIPVSDVTLSATPPTNTGSTVVKTLTETSVSSEVEGASGFSAMYHVVEGGETLSRIAVKYHQKIADLRQWNHLTNDNIVIGKKLIVGSKDNYLSTQKSAAVLVPSKHIVYPDLVEATKKGTAEWETGTSSSNGMLTGLCSVVPEGSVVKVTNPVNNETILVKIIGILPSNDESENVLIKIPETAARQLNASDEKFDVSLTYFTEPLLSLK